jgi:cysteine synthase
MPPVLDASVVDEIVTVTDDAAIACARQLGAREGIFCGISAGATLAGALQIAAQAPAGSVLLAMLPDTGERYLSTALLAGVETGSDTV